MSNTEIEYILWLSKRLVHKYHEDPKIATEVERILFKNQTEIKFYSQIFPSISKYIDDVVLNLHKIKSIYSNLNSTHENRTTHQIKNANDLFENLDMKSLT